MLLYVRTSKINKSKEDIFLYPIGNWGWRFSWDQLTPELEGTYRWLGYMYERPKKEKIEKVE